jgi:hypothetical protein
VSTQASEVSWPFSVPGNQGDSVQVCVRTGGLGGILSPVNCQYVTTTDESGSYFISLDSPQ